MCPHTFAAARSVSFCLWLFWPFWFCFPCNTNTISLSQVGFYIYLLFYLLLMQMVVSIPLQLYSHLGLSHSLCTLCRFSHFIWFTCFPTVDYYCCAAAAAMIFLSLSFSLHGRVWILCRKLKIQKVLHFLPERYNNDTTLAELKTLLQCIERACKEERVTKPYMLMLKHWQCVTQDWALSRARGIRMNTKWTTKSMQTAQNQM